jgi:hypothetical protein
MIKTSSFSPRREQRGQSLVEMGISMIALLFILAGTINFGIAYFDYVAIRDAAQEGALYGSLNPLPTSGIISRVKQSSSNPVDLTTLTPTISTPDGTCPGNPLKVTISYDVPIMMPIVGLFTNSIHLTASATSIILESTNPTCPMH